MFYLLTIDPYLLVRIRSHWVDVFFLYENIISYFLFLRVHLSSCATVKDDGLAARGFPAQGNSLAHPKKGNKGGTTARIKCYAFSTRCRCALARESRLAGE